ncbi:MAG TPA: UvrD-helicase domain-containing protein [Pirellulaceae bacterium]|nr:UvrD-helicase domain-containing protein [Pirellulaceae bacterium]
MSEQLNPSQQTAVRHRSGPLLVLAGAGTGKTRVITYRIAQLVKSGVAADRILGVTFTNKAAQEMQQRLRQILPKKQTARPLIATFHAFAARVLRRQIGHLGYPLQFSIYSGGELEGVARSVLREINVADTTLSPSQLLNYISRWKNQLVAPDQAAALADSDQAVLAAAAYRRYQRSLKQLAAVDFDDLLLLTEKLFRDFPEVRRLESGRFEQILIDEFQDTNETQYRLVRHLAEGHSNLCVVGDDDQSIYGWRGAAVEHILNFPKVWPKTVVVRLEENYRSTASILDWANHLIAHNPQRHGKQLRAARRGGDVPRIVQYADEATEAREVVQSIQSRIAAAKREFRDFAILFRTNEQPRPFETALRQAKLPYVLIGGMSFFDRKEVQDVMAYLRVVINPHDDTSLLRVLNRPPRGFGGKTIERLMTMAFNGKTSIWSILTSRPGDGITLPADAANGFAELRRCFDLARTECELAKQPLSEVVQRLIESVGYRREIERLYREPEDQQTRWASVQQVINAVAEYQGQATKPKLAEFIDQMALGDRDLDDEKEKQLRQNAVVLMTLHSAKGLEFPEVYMVGMEEGVLPHRRSVEMGEQAIVEERRLCYVGVTRAQDRLTLSLPLSRLKWGKPRASVPSRFLYELLGKTDHPNYQQAINQQVPTSAPAPAATTAPPPHRRAPR